MIVGYKNYIYDNRRNSERVIERMVHYLESTYFRVKAFAALSQCQFNEPTET